MQRSLKLLPILLIFLSAPVSADEPKSAVYKVKEFSFSYRSSKAFYSCHALQQRVASILLALGARDDLQVRASNCDESMLDDEFPSSWHLDTGWGNDDPLRRDSSWDRASGWEDPYERFPNRRRKREQMAFVRVRAMMPIELTREVLAEIDRDKSRRELISRVTGDPTAKNNDPVVFPAQWQEVTLSRQSLGLKAEECELLDQMSSSVFKKLGFRIVERSAICSRYHTSRIAPTMTVEALLGTPIGATSLPQVGAESQSAGEEGVAEPQNATPPP